MPRVPDTFRVLAQGARLARDLPRFLRSPVTSAQAAASVTGELARRGERLVGIAGRAIYGHPGSPYLALLRAAGCELGDLRALVAHEGVEGALARLADQGVYVTFDEMKGRAEAVRGSRRFQFAEADFDSPLVRSHLDVPTSGSGGTPSRVGRSLPLIAELAREFRLTLDAHGAGPAGHVIWHPRPFHWFLIIARLGEPVEAWFHPIAPFTLRLRAGARGMVALGRLAGQSFPGPLSCDLRDPTRLLDWLAPRLGSGRALCLWTYSSSAARMASAATERGQRLDGLTVIVQGEPFTEARRRAVEGAGARAVVRYGSMEVPTIALSCTDRTGADDLHLLAERYAMVQRARTVGGMPVQAMLFTALSEAAPKILLNAETGDHARVETRACGCRLGALGLDTHLSEIASFEKLTGEGMTFARTNLVRVIEETLPARFGGTGLDYQVVEEETPGGATRLALLVSPRLGPLDAGAVREAFLAALSRGGMPERFMAEFWKRAETVEVRREVARSTPGGKVLPFHLARRDKPGGPRRLSVSGRGGWRRA